MKAPSRCSCAVVAGKEKRISTALDQSVSPQFRMLSTHIGEQRRALGTTIGQIMKHDRATASRYSKDRNSPWVASKLLNMILHPSQRKLLIQQSQINNPIPEHLFPSKESKRS